MAGDGEREELPSFRPGPSAARGHAGRIIRRNDIPGHALNSRLCRVPAETPRTRELAPAHEHVEARVPSQDLRRLTDDTRATDNSEDAARIAELCKGLPLALRIIAALLSENPRRPLAEMAADLDDERTRLDELSYGDTAVRAAFDLSYRRLDQDRARLFRLLTINPGPDISTLATAALASVDERVARRGLEALARAHLIGPSRTYGRWRMHDLLRLYAGQLSDGHADADGREQARDRLLGYYLDTAQAAGDHLKALPGMPVPARFTDREDALAWLDAERPSVIAAVSMAASTGRDEVAMRLPIHLATYLTWRRRFDDWLSVAVISRDAARRLGDRHNEATALMNLGIALAQVRRFEEAIIALRGAAVIYREIGDRHGEGSAVGNLGIALQQVRRFEEAITACQGAAAIYRETGDRHGEGSALTSLGIALQEVRRFWEAITALRGAAVIYQEIGDRHGEGSALTNLGIALQQVRRFEEAITARQGEPRSTGRPATGTARAALTTSASPCGRCGEFGGQSPHAATRRRSTGRPATGTARARR